MSWGRPLRLQRRLVPTRGAVWPDGLHPVLQRIYAARGIAESKQVEHRLARLHAPFALSGMECAVQRLADAIVGGQHILVAGDYDCDGATGVAVAVRGLRLLGASDVGYVVPNRFAHGYGLSPALIDSLEHTPDLIVTVDNGVASLAGVAVARARGIDVIVTDHHLPGERLPEAVAIVNPNLPGDGFPSKALAGVGVMFYLLLALRAHLRETHRFSSRNEPDLSVLLDLVALGTVADLVPLDHNNRILVEAGLRRMRAGRACSGIVALAESSRRAVDALVASDLAFALGPRLNAAGRLEDMALGVECLLTDNPQRARDLADLLSSINAERRERQAEMVAEAEAMLGDLVADDSVGVVVVDSGWHPGVVGLVASKLKERLHRPVIACAPAGEGSNDWRGSARSIPGFHIRDALAEIDACEPGLIGRFGGHAMAAGLNLPGDHLQRFREVFDAVARERVNDDLLAPVLWTDGELAPGQFDLELARALRYAGPWGQAFPEPLFDNVFECVRRRPMGVGHMRLELRDPRDGACLDAVMFQADPQLEHLARFRAAYALTVNDWQGRETPRLLLRHVEPV